MKSLRESLFWSSDMVGVSWFGGVAKALAVPRAGDRWSACRGCWAITAEPIFFPADLSGLSVVRRPWPGSEMLRRNIISGPSRIDDNDKKLPSQP
jgi:hypothetical protein